MQLEGTKSKSSEWPCAQTPVCGHSVGLARLRGSPEAPGPSPPLTRDVTSAWDHEEVCEKSPDPRVLGQASGHPVLLGREAGMSGDGALGAGEPPKFGESLGPHSWLSKWGRTAGQKNRDLHDLGGLRPEGRDRG